MTSATDELRRLLDERGVAHSDHYLSTTWRDEHGILHLAGEPMADGSLVVDMLTPEQAIAATLGSYHGYEQAAIEAWNGIKEWNRRHVETCENTNLYGYSRRFECSACGYSVIAHNCEERIDELPNYCPNCGRKVTA